MSIDIRFDADLPGIDTSVATASLQELDQYPKWLGLVHNAKVEDGPEPIWIVELGAKIGPFHKVKVLRMQRFEAPADESGPLEENLVEKNLVEENLGGGPVTARFGFARNELDDNDDHGLWNLDVEVLSTDRGSSANFRLRYSGDFGMRVAAEAIMRAEAAKAPPKLVAHLRTIQGSG